MTRPLRTRRESFRDTEADEMDTGKVPSAASASVDLD